MVNGYKYYAFISYKREDKQWASWLQHKIEHFKLPSNLNGKVDYAKGYMRPVFKDTSELTSGVLEDKIQDALDDSLYLIVICSPCAARSKWVNKEAQSFINSGRVDKIIPFIIAGEPNCGDLDKECYPQAFLQLPDSQELLGVNIGELGREAAAVKAIAYMLDLSFDSLWQREEREHRKRQRLLFSILSILLLLFASLAFFIWTQNKSLHDKNQIITDKNTEIVRQNERIAQSRDSILDLNEEIVRQNERIARSRDSILNLKYQQDIVVARNYLVEGYPEKSLVAIRDLEKNIDLVDSPTRSLLTDLKRAIKDSLSLSPLTLIAIDNKEGIESDTRNICHFSNTVDIVPYDDYSEEEFRYLLINSTANLADSVSIKRYVVSQSGEYLIVQKSSVLAVFSKNKGIIANDIPCKGWYDFMYYPMAISNNGRNLIYREGWREECNIWWYDIRTKRKKSLRSWTGSSSQSVSYSQAGFDSKDQFYFISVDGIVTVYYVKNHLPVFSISHFAVDTVFWDDLDNLCVQVDGTIYRWKRNIGAKTYVLKAKTLVQNVAISSNKKLCAAIDMNGESIMIWDIASRRTIYVGKPVADADDLEFANNDTELWITSGYNSLSVLNLNTLRVHEVKDDVDIDLAPHHWPCHLYITQDGRYCFTSFDYEHDFRVTKISEKKRVLINGLYYYDGKFAYEPVKDEIYFSTRFDGYYHYNIVDSSLSKITKEDITSDKIFIEFPKLVYYNLELDDRKSVKTTAHKISGDGTVEIEAMSNGNIIIRVL